MEQEMKGLLPDFDTLMQLAKDDPEALERLRQNSIAELLDSAPSHMPKSPKRPCRRALPYPA